MKMKRMLACILALLLVVSILPIGVMADDLPDNSNSGVEISSPIDTNNGNDVTVANGGSIQTNKGSVTTNNGEIVDNQGTVGSTKQPGLGINRINTDTGNKGTIGTNNATVYCNDGTVNINNNSVELNNDNGTVTTNNDTILNNKGTVGSTKEEEDGEVPDTDTGNKGEIRGNIGTVIVNDGSIVFNGAAYSYSASGDNGTVHYKDNSINDVPDATVKINNGTIQENYAKVETNAESGTIGSNKGTVGDNAGTVNYNFAGGTVDTNNGMVTINAVDGTVGTNNNIVRDNYGKVETNTIDGVVYNKTTQDQNGQNVTGKVTNNYGTVYNYDEEKHTDVATYGVQVKNTDGGTGTKLIQAVEDTIVKLADLFKRDGYELVGYDNLTPESDYPVELMADGLDDPSAPELSDTEFQATRPSILKLLWEKITGKPAAPSDEPEVKTAKTASILTSVSADKVKVGTFVRCGNMIFKIIEVNDDSIRVATVGKLSEQDLADMLAFLKKHLSDAQIAKIIGEPELLEEELVTRFFADNREHIAFRAEKDLFA